ncbi:MAG TPA: hypothetical protein VID69_06545 [Actinomycetota bacterium]|jgi:hypothetical protein
MSRRSAVRERRVGGPPWRLEAEGRSFSALSPDDLADLDLPDGAAPVGARVVRTRAIRRAPTGS